MCSSDLEILGKPENNANAVKMLQRLSGRKHAVHTSVAVCLKDNVEVILSSTMVEMMTLTDAMISAYVATGEQRDKAGSYGIQGKAGAWIKRIEGSYTGVMGLPLYETAKLLRDFQDKTN